uniref:Protein arginine N-methyltransferase n=3 Tax=Parascaris univalens TaxID=6257 RepID=A0A915BID2_PARUN
LQISGLCWSSLCPHRVSDLYGRMGLTRITPICGYLMKRRVVCDRLMTTAMFIEDIDHLTGERRWRVVDEDYDLAQEIARSGFADMLHDTQRNRMFDQALRAVIDEVHRRGERAHVLDIGAGTGLLSLMAARAGAERVTAVEVFKPMADCAKKIISASNYSSIIELISSRSTDLSFEDMNAKPNIIVAEVFDTELIGEGALRTFKEAHQKLVVKSCRVVPSSARVWILPVQSDFLTHFHRTPSQNLRTPFADCPGAAAIFDVQLSQLPRESIKMLSEPFIAFRFNFEDGNSIKYDESFVHEFVVSSQGTSHIDALLMWWELDMDGTGEHVLNTAPSWWDPNAQWRDHWMQGVYYLRKTIYVSNGQHISVRCSHDEFSMWFDVEKSESERIKPPVCSCRLHVTCSRNAMYRMNELDIRSDFREFLKRECDSRSVLCVNEGSFVGLIASKFAKKVAIVEPNAHFRRALHAYCGYNTVENVQLFANEEEFCGEVDVVLSEPFFLSSVLPWDNLRFWYVADKLRARYGPKIKILPQEGVLCAMPVKFDHLWKISAPVGSVESFDLYEFDNICQRARSATDAIVEPQPLWEYPSVCTGDVLTLATFRIDQPIPDGHLSFTARIPLLKKGTNAVVFWMDWKLSDFCMTSGLVEKCHVGGCPKWSVAHRQGVFFLPHEKATGENCEDVHCKVMFSPASGDVRFSFRL